MSRILRLGAFALLFFGLSAYLLSRLSVTTDMSKMMPVGENRDKAELARAIATSRLSQTVVLTVATRSKEQAALVSKRFEKALLEDPTVRAGTIRLDTGPPPGIERALYELYNPRRLSFAAQSESDAKRMVSDAGLRDVASRLKEQLFSPLSPLITRTAPADPFLALPRLFEGLERGAPPRLRIVNDRYVAEGTYAVLFLELKGSAFDADAQEAIVAGIHRAFSMVKTEFPDVLLEWSALARYSVSAKQAIARDITRVSVVSTALIVALSFLLFRSLRMLLLAFVPLTSGMLVGLLGVQLLYGEVHGLTLAFGASLIGVTIDAVVHYYVHFLYRAPGETAEAVMRRVAPAMALGGLTTVVGFLVLSRSAMVGLAQAAVFGACGVLVAYGVTFLILPLLVPHASTPTRTLTALGRALGRWYDWVSLRRRLSWGVLSLSLLIICVGAFQVRWDSDMARLLSFDLALEQEDARVRARVAQFDTSRFVVAWGANDEEALAHNQRAAELLEDAVRAGELEGYQSVAPLLPSAARQTAVFQVIREAKLQERMPPVLQAAGFSDDAFSTFWQHLKVGEVPLTFADIEGTPVAALVAPHRVTLGERVAWMSFLREPKNLSALEKRFAGQEGIAFLDQGQLMNGLDHRPAQLALLFVSGFALIVAMLWARYRSGSRAVVALLPALLATAVTVAIVSLFGFTLNLVAVSALLMVLSMGADYGVFMAENLSDPTGRDMEATLGALSVACVTTVVSFSVLAASEQRILSVIGWIAAVGVSCSFLFAVFGSAMARNQLQGRATDR